MNFWIKLKIGIDVRIHFGPDLLYPRTRARISS